MDGYLKIKTKIDNTGVDKDVQELENKIKKLQTDNAKNSQEQSSLQKEIDNYDELCQKADEYKNKIKQLEEQKRGLFVNGGLPSGQLTNYNSISTQIEQAKAEQTKLNAEIDKQSPKIDKISSKLEKVKAKQVENNIKIEEYKHKIEQVNLNHIQKGIDNVGKGIQSSISKIGKMTLAIFGIRTAINFVNSAISTLSQYNPQIATDIDYIKFALANSLLPVLQKIIGLAYTLLSYINAIMSGWFGINLFSGASAKNFQKMQSGASGTAKAVKEIQKSLQGFDEMNVLQDNSGSQTGSSGAGGVSPSMDLSDMQGEVPAWLQWIIDNKDLITSTLAGIATGIMAIKFGLSGIKALGIGIMVASIIKLIQDLQKYLTNPSWQNFGKIVQDIGGAILGLGLLIGNVPLIVAGAIAIIVGLVVSNWEKIKETLQKGIDWLKSKTDWVKENFGLVGEFIYTTFTDVLQGILDTLDGVFRRSKNYL